MRYQLRYIRLSRLPAFRRACPTDENFSRSAEVLTNRGPPARHAAGFLASPVQRAAWSSLPWTALSAAPVTGLGCPLFETTPGVNCRVLTFPSLIVTVSRPVSVLLEVEYQRKLPRP